MGVCFLSHDFAFPTERFQDKDPMAVIQTDSALEIVASEQVSLLRNVCFRNSFEAREKLKLDRTVQLSYLIMTSSLAQSLWSLP